MATFSSRLVRPAATATVLLAIGLSGACSGQNQSESGSSQVASAVSEKPGARPAAAPSERPLKRPDATVEEQEALDRPWRACMEKHGVDFGRKVETDYEGGIKKCEYLEAEEPWQRSQRTDPQYMEKFDRWLKCAKSRGVEVNESKDTPGMLSYPNSLPPPNQAKALAQCQIEAFSK